MMTPRAEQKIAFEGTTLDALYRDKAATDRQLDDAGCIFLSTTYLHTLSELESLIRRLKRTHNRIVPGGAMGGAIHDRWEGMPETVVLMKATGAHQVQIGIESGDPLQSSLHCHRPPCG